MDVFLNDPWWLVLIKAVFALVFLLVMTLFTIWFERRVVGLMQHRKGPTMNGPFGLLQSLADGVKLALKEDIIPKAADKWVFVLASWRMHLDHSSAVADAPYLLDTARPPVAVLSPQTAAAAGVDGHVTVSNDHGSITLPVQLAEEMVPGVVWLPARPRGHDVATHLAAASGDPVRIQGV